MPAKGKHRRPKSSSIARGFVAAGTGGAAIALPLLGATGAHAAEQSAAPAAAPQQAVTAAAKAAPSAAAAKAAPRTYTVVAGDYLSKIARNKNVKGGWQKLYQDNRQVIGENPSLILPGMKLTLGAKSTAKPAPAKAAPAKPKAEETRTESRASRSAAKAEAPAQPAAQTSGSGFTAPVDAGVTTPYRASGSSWSSGYHTGVDFAASSGSSVKAVGPGTVVSAGWSGAYGNEVVIQHADGNYSQYAHLSSLSVSSGQSVSGGQQIGLSGSTGNSTGPHLHFEIRTSPSYGSDIDPLAYLRQHGVSI
ncbi:LysM peptidoglycan-binding domain-containing M23 family metallopeptidase [Streptomyces ficellus]|uniref:LysM peptidoglycan-binding domain-containing M23 family metallopeptidase n=1 Tax=Streptomyces ficellus TaxID=1977088 RepID=A0ABT7Z7E6_9ACTN|nr:LysM peptidoglycan-binding domain-containing M23 family metallopeptidase [Streptomyces ficellus]MDN3295425.1 LysM peptidoglycan-binding domain-containing M23 family metallopeptidase [Streptomyces ficellus]